MFDYIYTGYAIGSRVITMLNFSMSIGIIHAVNVLKLIGEPVSTLSSPARFTYHGIPLSLSSPRPNNKRICEYLTAEKKRPQMVITNK